MVQKTPRLGPRHAACPPSTGITLGLGALWPHCLIACLGLGLRPLQLRRPVLGLGALRRCHLRPPSAGAGGEPVTAEGGGVLQALAGEQKGQGLCQRGRGRGLASPKGAFTHCSCLSLISWTKVQCFVPQQLVYFYS